jgi:hypothetical protein
MPGKQREEGQSGKLPPICSANVRPRDSVGRQVAIDKHPARYFLVESGGRGRESFSGNAFSMWSIVARKRLPTPLRPPCKATLIDKKLLAGCLSQILVFDSPLWRLRRPSEAPLVLHLPIQPQPVDLVVPLANRHLLAWALALPAFIISFRRVLPNAGVEFYMIAK